jgi:hypothetical protein
MKIAAMLVALVLVLAPISASAECPWVLWVEAPVGSDQWSIASVPQTRFTASNDCQRFADDLNAFERTRARCTGRAATPATSSAVSRAQSIRDRKDPHPRGPKGK